MIKTLFKIGLSLGVSFAILAMLLQTFTTGLSDGDRPRILTVLNDTSLSLVTGFLGLVLISLFVRAFRYRLLIRLATENRVPTMRQMVLVAGIRNMVVDMLPARLGELGYIGLLNKAYGVRLAHCVSSLSISIALDFIALLVIVILIVVKQVLGDGVTGWALGALIAASAISVTAITGLFWFVPWFTRVVATNYSSFFSRVAWRQKVFSLLKDFNASLQSILQSGMAGNLIGVSILIRILKYSGFYLLFIAVVDTSFPELKNLPVEQVVSALIGGEIASSLPIPAFMSFGVYEAGSALVFQLLGVGDQAATFVTMLCVHIWSQLIEYVLGGMFVVGVLFFNRQRATSDREMGSKSTFGSKMTPNPDSRIAKISMLFLATAFLLSGGLFLAYQMWSATKLGALTAPNAGQIVATEESDNLLAQNMLGDLEGFIVFSSNRDGNHDIFRRDLKTFELDKLTDHPHTETYPRISPNGNRLVFARAHQPWVSQRNTVAWDVYVLDLKTMNEFKVGSNGTAPHWLNNSEISYLHNADTVERVNVDTLSSSRIYQSGINNAMPLGAHLQNPKFNDQTKQLVFTARQSKIGTNTGHWGTAIDTGGVHRGVLNGCELAWSSDGHSLYQVNPGGPDGTLHIVRLNPQTLEYQTLINLEGEFTHEYWPKDSSNGEYMVFGASRGKHHHEHDTQDYEIFLWKVGSPSNKATRMTFHTGNDNWPDVYIR